MLRWSGRMPADRFWGRVFRSKYFQGGIGLADRQQEASDEDASEFIASFFKETVQLLLLFLLPQLSLVPLLSHPFGF